MIINIKDNKDIEFGDLPTGQLFIYGGSLYTKISHNAEISHDNAYCLNCDQQDCFNSSDIVDVPREVTVTL